MTSEMIGTISRFFFLSLLDESAAFSAATKTLQIWRARLSRSSHPDIMGESLLVATLFQQWQLLHKATQAGQPLVFSTEDWQLPPGLDLGPWLEFRKEALPEEFFAVLMVKVLGFSVDGTAQGLEVSEGTITHRLARGLRRLGLVHGSPTLRRV